MKKLIATLCTLISLSSYAQIVVDSDLEIGVTMELVGENGHQFEVEDPGFPGYYPDGDDPDGELPSEGYSYLWHTDEGHVSNAEQPIFFFATSGWHDVYLTLTPRKKGDEPRIFTTLSFEVGDGLESAMSHGDITDIDMYVDGQARAGDKIYVVVPLNSCGTRGMHEYKVAYNHSRLANPHILSQSNLSSGEVDLEVNMALGIPLTKKIVFSYEWGAIRNDVAAVIEFDVLELAIDTDERIGLKYQKIGGSLCDSDVEIAFSSIHGPYDPNYKESNISVVNVFEEPIKKISPTEVIYTIHFQNIGDAPVDSITVEDTLQPHLTFVSFEGSSDPGMLLSTSHVGGILQWIIAPSADVKGTNQIPTEPEPSTKGWVSFKAEISKEEDITYSICHCLSNKATIYFDELAPITTAADIITIGDALCFSPDPSSQLGESYAQSICGPNANSSVPSTRKKASKLEEGITFVAYPNPAREVFQLKGEVDKIQRIEVLNSLGQRVLSLSKYDTAISLGSQPNGIYFVRIVTEGEQQVIKIEKY